MGYEVNDVTPRRSRLRCCWLPLLPEIQGAYLTSRVYTLAQFHSRNLARNNIHYVILEPILPNFAKMTP